MDWAGLSHVKMTRQSCHNPLHKLPVLSGEMEDGYYKQEHRQPGEEEIQRPSGTRQYKVHRQSEQSEPGGTSGARQYR